MAIDERRTTRLGRQAPPARVTWTPGKLISGIIGLLLLVMGAVALFRLLTSNLSGTPQVEVLGVGHTALMAVLAIGVGLLYLAQSAYFAPGRATILGMMTLAFGLIVILEQGAFGGSLGIGDAGGWLYATIGIVSIVMGLSGSLFNRRP